MTAVLFVAPAASVPPAPGPASTTAGGEVPFPWAFHGSVPRRETWSGVVVVDPVDAAATPGLVSPERAVQACDHDAECLAGVRAEVYLGSATSPGTGDTGSDGTFRRRLDRATVYELVWTGFPCSPAGPAGGGPVTCTLVSWIDARSGRFVFGYQFARA